MGFELAHALFQHIVELDHFSDQFHLFRKFQALHRNRATLAEFHAAFARLLEDTGHAGVSVLDVKHRIFAGLPFGQIQIKIEMAILFSHKEEKPRRVFAYFFEHFFEGDKLARAFAHAHRLAAAGELHHLHQHNLQDIRIIAQPLHGRL